MYKCELTNLQHFVIAANVARRIFLWQLRYSMVYIVSPSITPSKSAGRWSNNSERRSSWKWTSHVKVPINFAGSGKKFSSSDKWAHVVRTSALFLPPTWCLLLFAKVCGQDILKVRIAITFKKSYAVNCRARMITVSLWHLLRYPDTVRKMGEEPRSKNSSRPIS